jgi:hypothetical protein
MGGVFPSAPPGAHIPSTGGGSGAGDLSGVASWLTTHVVLIVALAAAALAVIVAVVALMLWIGSRATFVYIDDVASGRAELSRPWSAHAERASSYFAWRFGMAAALLASIAVLVLLAVMAALLIARGGTAGAITGALILIVVLAAFVAVLLAGGVGAIALRDFVAPLQMHTGTGCGPAIRLFLALVRAHPVPFLLYLLLKVVFGVAQGVLLLAAACVTLCCILVPVVTQTALQPLFFFERAWSLFLLRQMGYDLFTAPAASAAVDAGPPLDPGAV